MRIILAAAALSILAIVPASAQSCVSNGAFVPCQGGMGAGMGMGGGMGGGMAPRGAGMAPGMMQPAGQGMSGDPMMTDQRMERRSSSRRATRTSRKQMMDANQ